MDAKRTMLVIDDIELNREVFAASFCDEYTILNAVNGINAIEIIEENKNNINIILLDIIMPEMNGIDFLKWLSKSEYSSIPVIAVSSDVGYQIEALDNGAWDFIPKPAENSVIKARINNVMNRYALKNAPEENKVLKKAKLQTDNLVNSIPGGIAIYKMTDTFETLYFSEGVAALSGHTREEYACFTRKDATKIIYVEDKPRVLDSIGLAIQRNEPIDETYRIYHKNGSLVWVHLNGVIIDEENGNAILHAVFQLSPRMAQLYHTLVNESQDIIYVSDINNYDLLYINKSGLKVVGKEAADYSCKKCYEFLFRRSTPCPFCKIDKMNTETYLERDFLYPLNNKIYSMRGRLTDWNGVCAHVEYVQDVTEIRKAEQNNADFTRQLEEIFNNIPGGMCVYRVNRKGIVPIIHNQAFFDIFGYSLEHQKEVLNSTNYLNVHPHDLNELQRLVGNAIRDNSKINHTYRAFNDKKNCYVWINMNAVVIPQVNGEKFCYVNYTDVTKEWEALEKLIETQKTLHELKNQAQVALENYSSLVNAVPGGIAQYEVDGSNIVTKFFSDGLCKLTGRSRDERVQMDGGSILSITYHEDLPALKQVIKTAVQNKENLSFTYRINTKNGSPRWVHLSAAYSCGPNNENYYHAVFTDIDKLKKIEQALQENQLRYEVAIRSSGINIWEYDIEKNSLYVVSNSSRIKQNCFYIENYTKSTIENGYVREDCIERFLSIFDRLKNGEKEITEDIWYKTTDEAGFWCERVTYTTTFNNAGKPIKAYGAGRDVTREKEAQKKFYEEISYRKAIQSDNLASIIVDLTANKILDVTTSFKSVMDLSNGTADEYFKETAKMITGDELVKEFNKTYTRKSLLNRFGSGEFVVPMELTRLYDSDKVYWINYSVHLIQNPETKNIVAHISCVDITQEKVMQTIMETISKMDYDFFVVVDGTTDSGKDYGVSNGRLLYDENQSFEKQNEIWIRSCVCAEDLDRVIEECKIKTAWSHVKDGKPYKFSFSMKMPNGEIRRKQIQFTSISPQRKTYLMSRIDVNNIYIEQEAAKFKLQKALTAKSEFLSNMSHDMRTPMNAIIGFSQMAMDQSTTEEELRDYVGKINKSGNYLLNLINDVLDMAKIENNKMELNLESVDSSELFNGIISSVKPMMDEKHIDFIFEIRNFVENKSAMLDKTRMQQIFINLLSNATKFTPFGGKIECIIESLDFDGRFSKEKILIRDSGCGMSQAFLQKAFLPFEQEHSGNSPDSGGTGLGLSIVKNLVELMGGTITLESTVGVGTEVRMEFTVELIDKVPKNISDSDKIINDDMFRGKRILLCEDHPLNCEIASRLLIKKGFFVEIADNGAKGLTMFNNSFENYYSAILMDIRMPVMDGLQAATEIRKLKRSDAETVPIIAMTANAFDDDVRKSFSAGMNAHLAKPIEPQKLYETLGTLIEKSGVTVD